MSPSEKSNGMYLVSMERSLKMQEIGIYISCKNLKYWQSYSNFKLTNLNISIGFLVHFLIFLVTEFQNILCISSCDKVSAKEV